MKFFINIDESLMEAYSVVKTYFASAVFGYDFVNLRT